MQQDQVEKYMTKYLIYSILWSMAGDGRLKSRQELGDFIKGITDVPLPPTANMLIIDYEVIGSLIYSSSRQTCNITSIHDQVL